MKYLLKKLDLSNIGDNWLYVIFYPLGFYIYGKILTYLYPYLQSGINYSPFSIYLPIYILSGISLFVLGIIAMFYYTSGLILWMILIVNGIKEIAKK